MVAGFGEIFQKKIVASASFKVWRVIGEGFKPFIFPFSMIPRHLTALGKEQDDNIDGDLALNWSRDTQHNDTQHNGTQHNDNQHNETQHNNTQHNNTQHNNTQHNDTKFNDTSSQHSS